MEWYREGENQSTGRKTGSSATSSTINLVRTGLGSNPTLRGDRSATTRLRHGTVRKTHPYLLYAKYRDSDENCALLGCYASSRVKKPKIDSWPLNMGPIGCPETSVINYHYSLRNNPEPRSCHLLRGGNLLSPTYMHSVLHREHNVRGRADKCCLHLNRKWTGKKIF